MDHIGFTHSDFDLDAHRVEPRDSMFLAASLRVAGAVASQQVRVRNLSPGGLMADYPAGLEQGTPLVLSLRGLGDVAGRVAWSAAGRIGIAFDRLVDPMLARTAVAGASDGTPPDKALFEPF